MKTKTREKQMRKLLHFAVDELYREYLTRGGEVAIKRTLNLTAIVWTRSSVAPKEKTCERCAFVGLGEDKG
jgi:hypothetical protein